MHLKRSVVGLDVSAAEDKPTVVEIEAFLPEGNFNVMNESPGMLADGHTLSNTTFTVRQHQGQLARTGRPATSCSTTKGSRSFRC